MLSRDPRRITIFVVTRVDRTESAVRQEEARQRQGVELFKPRCEGLIWVGFQSPI